MRLDVPGRYTTRASYDILWMLAAPCVLQQDRILVLGDASVSMTRIISFKETPMVESRSVWMRKGFVCGDFATGSTFTGLISAPGLVVEKYLAALAATGSDKEPRNTSPAGREAGRLNLIANAISTPRTSAGAVVSADNHTW